MRRVSLLLMSVLATVTLGDGPVPLPKDTLPAKLAVQDVPLGLSVRVVPKDSPLTQQRVDLGRRLFFDPILSGDRTVSCASCHPPERGFSEGNPRGIGGKKLTRRAPTLFNRAFGQSFFWDGRVLSLEEQALKPIEDPNEMGAKLPEVLKQLGGDASYRKGFTAAFDDSVTKENLAKALASFQRVLLRGDSAVDRFRKKGEHTALTPAERSGLWLFESKAKCWRCHAGANFTNERFHNTGVGWGKKPLDLGRAAVTKKDEDNGKFKTPTLRGVKLTAPYMHDGSIKTLAEVVEFYNKGGNANPNLDSGIEALKLSKEEMADLVTFLEAL